MEQDVSLREALAEDRLDDFVRQEEDRRAELAPSLLQPAALAPAAYVRHPMDVRRSISTIHTLRCVVERCLDAPLLLPTARLDRITY